ncbi:hypothetical protein RGQ13_11710 [Thalassotalea psychrophila]|uniref:Uncharacterized protein n=1 Tax=Thalassotalea psychrophila TaxID=3065647 RepID=A0ABY9TPT7_9GAMM|nr:hypothetical protein RGQ13_11710 [Colwelliaceae bacterium SQ149]
MIFPKQYMNQTNPWSAKFLPAMVILSLPLAIFFIAKGCVSLLVKAKLKAC